MGMMDYVRLSKSKGFSFNGRSRRAEFWWVQLYYNLICTAIIFGVVCVVVFSFLFDPSTFNGDELSAAQALVSLLGILISCGASIWAFIMTLPVSVRRLHDVGIPGWVYAVLWFLGWSSLFMLVIGCIDGERGQNKYGMNPKERPSGDYNRPHGIDPTFYN